MKSLAHLLKFMKGNIFLYLCAFAAVVVSTFLSYINPLIIRHTIDSVIGSTPLPEDSWFALFLELAGGRQNLLHSLYLIGALLIGVTALQGLFSFLHSRLSAGASENIVKRIRDTLYDHIQHLSFRYHTDVETGDLIQRCSADVETLRKFLASQVVEVGRVVIMLTFIIPIMLSINVKLTLFSILVIPLMLTMSIIFFLRIKKDFKVSDELDGKMSTILQENLTGVRVVKAFAREEFEYGKYNEVNKKYRDQSFKLMKNFAFYFSLTDLLSLCQIALILIVGSLWTIEKSVTIGTLVVFLTYVGMLLWPVRMLGRVIGDLGKALVSIDRIEAVLAEKREPDPRGLACPDLLQEIVFDRVHFSYNENKKVLSDISFSIKPGQTIAILGKTGSGKSSLVHLLPRLYEYTAGSITIGGIELNKIDKKYIRKNLGLILQEPFLYARSVRDNISLARIDAQEAQIIEAARDAWVHDAVLDFEKGYSTLVGEQGVTLSGGQVQRIAIARTLITESPVLIFDDSLSAVDTHTDVSIRQALKKRKKKATTIIIAHRITTLSEADLILVLDKGRIIQQGTHEILIKEEGLYKKMWAIQNELEDDLQKEMD